MTFFGNPIYNLIFTKCSLCGLSGGNGMSTGDACVAIRWGREASASVRCQGVIHGNRQHEQQLCFLAQSGVCGVCSFQCYYRV